MSHTPDDPDNFNAAGWDWHAATEYGTNDLNDPNIWRSVGGISYEAKWIWDGANYGDANKPFYQEIFVRATFETAPFPNRRPCCSWAPA